MSTKYKLNEMSNKVMINNNSTLDIELQIQES